MDGAQFDALARTLAGRVSRRGGLGAIVAATLAPLTTAAQPEPSKCLANGKRCRQRDSATALQGNGKRKKHGERHPHACKKCCSRFSAPGANGKPRCTCKTDELACDNDAQCCSGRCRDGVCGSCPQACDPGLRCLSGACRCDETSCPAGCIDATTCSAAPCDQGFTLCDGACVDTSTDPLNCGGCGKRCPVNESCVGGAYKCGALGHSAAPSTCCTTDGVCIEAAPDADTFVKPDPCAFVDACPTGYTSCIAGADSGCRACCPPGTTCIGGAEGGYCLQGGVGAVSSRAGRRSHRRERSGRGGRRR